MTNDFSNEKIDLLINNSKILYDDFILILPENYNELELVFCVQTLITYCFWNKLVKIEEKDFQQYAVRDMIERGASVDGGIIPGPDDLEKGQYRSSEYRSALQPGSENTWLLSGLIYKNLYNNGEGMPDCPPELTPKIIDVVHNTIRKCTDAQTEFLKNVIKNVANEHKSKSSIDDSSNDKTDNIVDENKNIKEIDEEEKKLTLFQKIKSFFR